MYNSALNHYYLDDDFFKKKVNHTLCWLEHSILNHKGGSAAYFSLLNRWGPPYLETTGYLIETLYDYAAYFNDEHFKDLATQCASWLCTLQLNNGAFPGGLGTQGQPLIFDTGQILFGLTRAYTETNHPTYAAVIEKAVQWLLGNLEEDGSWKRFSYVQNYVPSYYTRVVWAILFANKILKNDFVTQKMNQSLYYYTTKITPQKTIQNWAFTPDEAAYTHTIAYTLEGLLESAFLLKKDTVIKQVEEIVERLIKIYLKKGKLAGSYDENWQGDYSFICVTGNAQLSVLLYRLYQITRDTHYLPFASSFFKDIINTQWTIPIRGLRGAIPGSQPIWGAYQRFRFPNWAAKFYLDAYLLLKKDNL